MADELEFSLTARADMSVFKEDVRAGVAEAVAQVVNVPVRGAAGSGVASAGAGGQGSRVPVSYSAAEQRAVDDAVTRSYQQYGSARGAVGYSQGPAAMGGGPGGGSLSANIDTNQAEIAFRRVRGIWQALKDEIERTPIRMNVQSAGMSGMHAGGSGPGNQVPWGATSPNYSYLHGGRGHRPSGPSGLAPNINDLEDLVWDASGKALGATREDQEYRDRVAGRSPGTSPRSPGGGSGGGNIFTRRFGTRSGLGDATARGIIGLLGVQELAGASQSIREGNSDAGLASTREEAQLARARGLERATSGLIGSALTFIPNALDLDGSPQRMLREANEAVGLRQSEEQRRATGFGIEGDAAYRSGYRRGGRGYAEIERLRVETRQTVEDANRKANESEGMANERTEVVRKFVGVAAPVNRDLSYTEGGGYVQESGVRLKNLSDAKKQRELSVNALSQLGFAEEEYNADIGVARLSSDNAVSQAKGFARAINKRAIRAVNRQSIVNKYGERLTSDKKFYGDDEGFTRNTNERDAELLQFDSSNRMDDMRGLFSRGASAIARAGNSLNYARQLTGQRAVLDLTLARNPEGAAIAQNSNATNDRLRDTQNLPFGIRQLVQAGLRGVGSQQEQLIRRQFQSDRFETGEALDAANRQSRMRQAGGRYQLESELDEIVTGANRDRRALQESGKQEFVAKSNTLAANRIQERRKDFYRNVRFEEARAGLIETGTGNPFGNADKPFKDAEARIGKDGGVPDQPGSADKGTQDLLKKLDELIAVVRGKFVPKAT